MGKGGRETHRQNERGATCVKKVFLYELCGIGPVSPHVRAAAAAGFPCLMKYEAAEPLSDSGWGRSGMGVSSASGEPLTEMSI